MSDEDELRARLAGLSGPARARPLLELVQKLSDRYWRTGPGKPAALPVLDEAVAAVDEAYGYFGPEDGMRRSVAGMRGWLHGTRHLAHLGPDTDRAIAVEQLEEALVAPDLPPMMFAMCRITLGQLHMSSVNRLLQSPDIAAKIMSGGVPAGAAGELDRAVACFEQVAASTSVPREARETSRVLIRMAGALRTIVTASGGASGGGSSGGSGLAAVDRLMEAMSVLREIHEEQSALLTVTGGVGSFYGADRIADQPPVDRPVPLTEYDDGPPADPPEPTRTAPPRETSDPASARRELRALVSAGGDLFESLEALLDPGAPPPGPAMVDDLVALATEVTDAGGGKPTDDLLLAAALCLRARAGGGPGTRRDLDEAVDALLRAAAAPRPATPEALRVMRRLAALADAADPAGRAADRLSYVLDERIGNRR